MWCKVLRVLFAILLFNSVAVFGSNIFPIDKKVEETIEKSSSIPGLQSDEYQRLKGELLTIWNRLITDEAIDVHGEDRQFRPCFVALQAIIEHVLSYAQQEEGSFLYGVIHTPMPATPLCTKGDISPDLLDPSVEKDPLRLFTVKARTVILRDYLFQGGKLYVVYPQGGLQKRSEEQQRVFLEMLKQYSAKLVDCPLSCDAIPDELIGATYFFTDSSGKTLVFSIRMTQAKDPREEGHFGLWFGELRSPKIAARVREVCSFLQNSSSDIFDRKLSHLISAGQE